MSLSERILWAALVLAAVGCIGCNSASSSDGEPVHTQEPEPSTRPIPDQSPVAAAPSPHGEDIATHAAITPSDGPRPAPRNAAANHGPVSTALSKPPRELAKSLTLQRVARGFKRPVAIEHAPGDASGRLFVVEQHIARIAILKPTADGYEKAKKPFLSLRGKVSKGNEQGLLGLAFHPHFAENRRLFVYYTDRRGTTRVVEHKVAKNDPDRVDKATAREIFRLEQPYSNHNAGDLEFGPDGKLYVGTGDGGAAGDPLRAGQDAKNLLAKMLRFDVDAAASGAVEPEMVQLGLRNPWRYAFDARTGDLYIGDVGQSKFEFIYAVAGDDLEGHNFGWNIVEGNQCYRRKRCNKEGFTPAVIEYSHATGCSVTGGEVYRGKAIPELDGAYFYADFCTSIIRSFRWAKDGVRQHWDWRRALDRRKRITKISSFGRDANGELLVVSLRGSIYKLARKAK